MEHLLVSAIRTHGYLAIFALMTLESACIPIPSEAIMGFAGALTAGITIAGVAGHFSLWAVTLAGTLGNLLGALVAYLVGRTGGRALVERYGKYLLIRHRDLDRAEAYFARRGALAVLIGRLLPVVRTFISFPAGVAEMPVAQFGLFTLLGSLPWTFGLAYAGRVLAANWQALSTSTTPISVLVVLVILAFFGDWYRRRRREEAVPV